MGIDEQASGSDDTLNTLPNLLIIIEEAGLGNLIATDIKNTESVIWYRELISRSESHPRNKARIVRSLLTLTGRTKEEQEINFKKYEQDYSDFYENSKPCTARIALTSGPLFVRFRANERQQFQDIVGLIPEEMLDLKKPDDTFLYAV